jgi:hypothetical protein
MNTYEGCCYKNLTATGTIVAQTGGALQLFGFYVNSTSSGTIAFADSAGTISGTITPAIGFHRFPCTFTGTLTATIGGTLNVTLFYGPQTS